MQEKLYLLSFFDWMQRMYAAYFQEILTAEIVLILLLVGLLFVFLNRYMSAKKLKKQETLAREQTLQAISGEDVNATKLDLARAYIDMNEKSSAKTLLQEVIEKGSRQQQMEAKRLIGEAM